MTEANDKKKLDLRTSIIEKLKTQNKALEKILKEINKKKNENTQ